MPAGLPIILTIDGVSKTVGEWSLVKGAVGYHTIASRFHRGWDPRDAVFGPRRAKSDPRGRAGLVPRRRSRTVVAPTQPTPAAPFRPTLGSFKSYPIAALDALRRGDVSKVEA